ncbi:heparan-alpha-glucosaminide N-acetyltransferase, partial [Desulfofundulus sp.]|uniref:heparan-alpha-glucosaminide N-acetyltransferase n=1 Tax=Desulfofundulus sp. TaxID=2282750 RepID=UPI003C782F85
HNLQCLRSPGGTRLKKHARWTDAVVNHARCHFVPQKNTFSRRNPAIKLTASAGTINVNRIWEIDLARGAALLLMVAFHLIYDLAEFYHLPLDYQRGLLYYMGKGAATLFILIAGLSSFFSTDNLRRGIKLLLWGFIIYIITGVVLPGSNIIFGILQFLGTGILLAPLFKGMPLPVLTTLGALILLAGRYTGKLTLPHNWLAWLGFMGENFSSVDYYPLIPWFGVFLWGMALRQALYPVKRSLLPHFPLSRHPLGRSLQFLGRHSLTVYLVHQPVILLLLYLFFLVIK